MELPIPCMNPSFEVRETFAVNPFARRKWEIDVHGLQRKRAMGIIIS